MDDLRRSGVADFLRFFVHSARVVVFCNTQLGLCVVNEIFISMQTIYTVFRKTPTEHSVGYYKHVVRC